MIRWTHRRGRSTARRGAREAHITRDRPGWRWEVRHRHDDEPDSLWLALESGRATRWRDAREAAEYVLRRAEPVSHAVHEVRRDGPCGVCVVCSCGAKLRVEGPHHRRFRGDAGPVWEAAQAAVHAHALVQLAVT